MRWRNKKSNKSQYMIDKKEAKETITVAKNNAYEMLYQKLKIEERKKEVFKTEGAREKRTRDLANERYIKDATNKS